MREKRDAVRLSMQGVSANVDARCRAVLLLDLVHRRGVRDCGVEAMTVQELVRYYDRLLRLVVSVAVVAVASVVLVSCGDPSIVLVLQHRDAGIGVVSVEPAGAAPVDRWCGDPRCMVYLARDRKGCLCPYSVDGAVFESSGANASPICQRLGVTLYLCGGDAGAGSACCEAMER